MELADFDELWGEARDFRPILATMVAHGDLQFENSELFCVYFGNLPAYTLTFMNSFLKQLNKEVVAHPRYWPKQPKVPLERELSDSECMKAWSKRTPQAMDVFTRRVKDFHTEGILAKVHQIFPNLDKYNHAYPSSDFTLVNRFHFLIVYREAIRIQYCYMGGKIPLVYPRRQYRCLPYKQSNAVLLEI